MGCDIRYPGYGLEYGSISCIRDHIQLLEIISNSIYISILEIIASTHWRSYPVLRPAGLMLSPRIAGCCRTLSILHK